MNQFRSQNQGMVNNNIGTGMGKNVTYFDSSFTKYFSKERQKRFKMFSVPFCVRKVSLITVSCQDDL